VSKFVYFASLITNSSDCSADINRRINLAGQRMDMLKTLWSSRELIELRLMC